MKIMWVHWTLILIFWHEQGIFHYATSEWESNFNYLSVQNFCYEEFCLYYGACVRHWWHIKMKFFVISDISLCWTSPTCFLSCDLIILSSFCFAIVEISFLCNMTTICIRLSTRQEATFTPCFTSMFSFKISIYVSHPNTLFLFIHYILLKKTKTLYPFSNPCNVNSCISNSSSLL